MILVSTKHGTLPWGCSVQRGVLQACLPGHMRDTSGKNCSLNPNKY